MTVNLRESTQNHSEQAQRCCIIQWFIHKYGIEAFAAGAALQPVIYLSCVRTSSRVQHFHNINATVNGNTHHTRPYDKACDILKKKEHICNEQMALGPIQHNYCHQQGQDGAQCLTCSHIQSVCWVKAIIGEIHGMHLEAISKRSSRREGVFKQER